MNIHDFDVLDLVTFAWKQKEAGARFQSAINITNQTKDTLIVRTDTDEFRMVGRPCELSSFSFVPTERNEPKERTYFNSEKQVS